MRIVESYTDPYTRGARDCRAGRPDQSHRMGRPERAAYRQGYRAAFRRIANRLDAAAIFPGHFTQES